jgi:hypothetical protein
MAEIAKMKIPSKLTAAEPPIKVLYPTLKTVDDTLLGREGGGSMFCTPSHFTTETRPYFADSVCKYGSLLMHTKVRSRVHLPRLCEGASLNTRTSRRPALSDDPLHVPAFESSIASDSHLCRGQFQQPDGWCNRRMGLRSRVSQPLASRLGEFRAFTSRFVSGPWRTHESLRHRAIFRSLKEMRKYSM